MSTVPEIARELEEAKATKPDMSTVPEIAKELEEEKATEPQNKPETITTTGTREITQKEATPESVNSPTPLNNSTQPANAQNQQKVSSSSTQEEEVAVASPITNQEKQSSVPEITPPDLQAVQATSTNHSPEPQNKPKTITPTSTPEITQKEATPESVNPPTPLNNSTQPENAQNQQNMSSSSTQEEEEAVDNPITNQEKLSSVPEITPPDLQAVQATSANPPKPQNQETTLSSVPEITPKEPKAAAATVDSSAEITEETISENEALKKTDFITSTPPEIETPKQDSTNGTGADHPPEETQKIDSTNISPQADETTDPHSKKDSFCLPLLGFHKSREKTSQSKNQPVQDRATASTKDKLSKSTEDPIVVPGSENSKDVFSNSISADIDFIIAECEKLKEDKDRIISQVDEAKQKLDVLKKSGTDREFRELKKEITKLKLKIPSKHKADADEKDSHKSQQASKFSRKNITEAVMKQMPQLYHNSLFKDSAQVKDFEAVFHRLSSMELKLCLLCFAVFPENAIIKKRLMVYWWIAEGFVPPIPRDDEPRDQIAHGKTAEEFADEYFQELTKVGFIEPVNKKCSLYVGCFKMHPFVRLGLVMMAEKYKFFNFDEEGNPTEKSSGTFQACLMGRGLLDYQDLQKRVVHVADLEKLHAVFNVDETILDFKPEWFSMMKNLNVLYLGRWKVSPTDHIEVEETSFLDELSTMDHLKFFSLQGVSRIMELPESIAKLSSLMILDLRACHSLESIPEGIRHLKNLTYLDISECYLLEHMPKGLSMLSNLRILKGFVVGGDKEKHACSLNDLAKLEKLIKLCIYTGLSEFPTDKDIKALQNFKALEKLTMAWGGGALQTKADDGGQRKGTPGAGQKQQPRQRKETPGAGQKNQPSIKQTLAKLKTLDKETPVDEQKQPTAEQTFAKLKKLDLKSFPKSATPSWLVPSSFKSLKKLYIRGGKFSDLGQYQYLDQKDTSEPAQNKWEVEILRLKYLNDLEMDWRELRNLFPNLIYLEKVNCPKLSFFPSDGYGVWINKEKLKQMQVRS